MKPVLDPGRDLAGDVVVGHIQPTATPSVGNRGPCSADDDEHDLGPLDCVVDRVVEIASGPYRCDIDEHPSSAQSLDEELTEPVGGRAHILSAVADEDRRPVRHAISPQGGR